MKKREKLELVRQYYPNAITTIDSVNMVIDYFENVLDTEPSTIMLADSICSDDVNSIQYPARTAEFLGPFKMGGLDGFPFTGLTGMAAFASHVPDEGAVFIYYGPHIGITKEGSIGEINRFGQQLPTSCCGAAKGALHKLIDKLIEPGNITEIDYQMNTIEQILLGHQHRILSATMPLIEATEVMYEAIDERINKLVADTEFHCNYIILMGAILINSDSDMGSFTSTRRFEVIDIHKHKRTNLLTETFPQLNHTHHVR
jgi:hypothetical protein